MSTEESTQVAEGLFADTDAGPRLLGSRCTTCSTPYFPKAPVCHNPTCDASAIEDAEFGPSGTLWSCAIQHYPPPPPTRYDEPYKPFALAMIDLDEGLRVMGQVSTDDPMSVPLGCRVELVLEAMYHDEDGKPVITWKFRPV